MVATYRQPKIYLFVLLTLGLSVAMPIIAVVVDGWTWWERLLLPVIAIPGMWFYVLHSLVYRIDLTATDLRLRALLGVWRVPLSELSDFGRPINNGQVRLRRRDGRSWTVLGGTGLSDFADAVAAAAPHARAEVSGWQRTMDRAARRAGS